MIVCGNLYPYIIIPQVFFHLTHDNLESSLFLYYPIINFGRYCNASARCTDSICSLPAKSAIVRAS